MPFREAHGVVAGLVRERGRPAAAALRAHREELAASSPLLDDEFYAVLASGAWLESKVSEGGTACARVREQLDARRARRARERSAARLLRAPGLEVARDLIGCVVSHAARRA